MSRTESVDTSMWTASEDFEALSPYATLLYLWSFTNPRCGMAGIYRVTRRAMTESKVPREQIDATLDELAAARFAYYEDGVLWVRTRARRLRSKTPQMAKSVRNDLREIAADHPLRARFLAEYREASWLREHLAEFDPPRGYGDPQRPSPNLALEREKEGGSPDPRRGSIVNASVNAKGKKFKEKQAAVARAREAGFDDWLADHRQVTGRKPPGEKTAAYAFLAEAFNGRIADGLTPDDLKLATRGAHGNDFRRENGYNNAQSVLRATKCHDLVEDGKRMQTGRATVTPIAARAGFYARGADDQPEWPELEDSA